VDLYHDCVYGRGGPLGSQTAFLVLDYNRPRTATSGSARSSNSLEKPQVDMDYRSAGGNFRLFFRALLPKTNREIDKLKRSDSRYSQR
jgi:hypothetical protein